MTREKVFRCRLLFRCLFDSLLGFPGDLGLSDETWDERLDVLADVSVEFDSQHLDIVHLFVEELDDSTKFCGNLIRNEEQTYSSLFEVVVDL